MTTYLVFGSLTGMPKTDKTPIMVARRRCHHCLLFFLNQGKTWVLPVLPLMAPLLKGKENIKAGIICFLVSVPQKVSENYMYSIKNYWMWLC
jgi:hypothetical protein